MVQVYSADNATTQPDYAGKSGLSWMLAPLDLPQFIAKHWCREPLLISRSAPSYYVDLLPERELEHALWSASQVPGAVEILTAEAARTQRARGYHSVQQAIEEGKSVRIDAIQRFSRELMHYVRRFEQELACIANVNLYYSPRSSRALPRHFDRHDVFVLQIYGQKQWTLFDSHVESPLEYVTRLPWEPRGPVGLRRYMEQPKTVPHADPVPTRTFTLQSGDLLYLPRGHWHVASTDTEGLSCHLTIGAQVLTYLDLLTFALNKLAPGNSLLRSALPLSWDMPAESGGKIQDTLLGILRDLPERINTMRVLGELAESFTRSRVPMGMDLLQSAAQAALTPSMRMRVQSGCVCAVVTDERGVSVVFGARKVTLPHALGEVCRFIVTHESFAIGDLPGEMTDADKVALTERLMREGLLTPAVTSRGQPKAPMVDEPGWVPTRLECRGQFSKVNWMRLTEPLIEPMFSQTLTRLLTQVPPAPVRVTSLKQLRTRRGGAPPLGFIFHVSRCGSTLLSNLAKLSSEVSVISEPQVFGALLQRWRGDPGSSRSNSPMVDECLRGAMAAFGGLCTPSQRGIIVKFTSWQLLQIEHLRRLWPSVPCLLVIRDPVEVMVSCMDEPPGWMELVDNPAVTRRVFGWSPEIVATQPKMTRCAMALSQFFDSALRSLGPRCRVLDYADIGMHSATEIAHYFGLADIDPQAVARCMQTYSKDSKGKRSFVADRDRKHAAASDELRAATVTWVSGVYDALLQKREFHLGSLQNSGQVSDWATSTQPAVGSDP